MKPLLLITALFVLSVFVIRAIKEQVLCISIDYSFSRNNGLIVQHINSSLQVWEQ